MATLNEIVARLSARFEGVPNVTEEVATAWVIDAIERHGYTEAERVPSDEIYLVLLLAQAEGARQIALQTAHYFNYQDSDERVDKAEVSAQYMRLSQALYTDYKLEAVRTASGGAGARFKTSRRVDRDGAPKPFRRYR